MTTFSSARKGRSKSVCFRWKLPTTNGWGFEIESRVLLLTTLKFNLAVVQRTVVRKNLRVRRSGFNFSHSNCQGSPLSVRLSASVERTEEYHQTLELSSVIQHKAQYASQTVKTCLLPKMGITTELESRISGLNS